RDIKAFEKKEYWTIDAHLAASKPPAFDARFLGKGEDKIEIPNGDEAEKIRAAVEKADWLVRTVDRKERRRNAAPPFTTSKLQQDSSRKLRFSVKRTMMIAQRLYEGVELGEEGSVGLITYMRTDSTRVSNDALAEVREYIKSQYGDQYLPESPNTYKEKKEAQAAHEAIRPTSAMRHPDQIKQYLKEDEYKVYKLIWQRFVASQITPAVFDQTTVDIDAKSTSATFWFRVTCSVQKYDTNISMIKELDYVHKLCCNFDHTQIVIVVTYLIIENFPNIFDVQYIARLEEELDKIEEGKQKWTDALAEFYKKFEKDLRYAQKHMENIKRMEKPTDEKCELCGAPLVIKWGKHGSFYACSTYDKDDPNTCKFTKENTINLPDLDSADLQETTQEEYCENCGR